MNIEKTLNRSIDDIDTMCEELSQSIRNYFSKLLMEYTEDSPLKCKLEYETIDSDFVPSPSVNIDAMYQDTKEGYIFIHEEFMGYTHLDWFAIQEQIRILKALINYLNENA